MPRAQLDNFLDVADHEILLSRAVHRLERYVPFHFFAGNPFDGRIQPKYAEVQRHLKENGFLND